MRLTYARLPFSRLFAFQKSFLQKNSTSTVQHLFTASVRRQAKLAIVPGLAGRTGDMIPHSPDNALSFGAACAIQI
jgi:hypothetical protein